MKKKSSFILILIFIFNFSLSFAEELIEPNEMKASSEFYNSIKNDELPFLKGIWPSNKYNDFGFYVKIFGMSRKKNG